MLSRPEREEFEDGVLAPGATRACGAGNRLTSEPADPFRTCFEKDLDRVQYSPVFRRLAHKCQVFIAPVDDHLRTRLTHAVEVAQVAVAISRRCRLNLALTSAAALFHDCGHGPAGHASEEAFSPFLPGGFDHALWGADEVATPLNLCAETVDAIRCHSWRLPAPATPEGEVVSIADRVAYLAHDFDDAVRAGILSVSELPGEVAGFAGVGQSAQVGAFVDDVCSTVARTGRVALSPDGAAVLAAFRRFMYERVYLRPAAERQAARVIAMLGSLVEFYADAPGRIPDVGSGLVARPVSGSSGAVRAAVGYVSGMTDRFAIASAVELLGWDVEALPQGV